MIFIFALLALALAGESRGFNDNIKWLNSLEDGIRVGKETNTPVFVLIAKSWCGACKALKATFAGSTKIAAASADFVMVNLQDDEEPSDAAYKPDGGYIPRILFVWNGAVDASITAEANPKYKYYYSTEEQVLAGMKRAKAKLGANKEDL